MKLKFGEENNFLAGRISPETVKKMVQKHRKGDPLNKKLKYAHFNVYEVLELFIDNEVLPAAICKQIKEKVNQEYIKKYGLKIYLGKHDKDSCPENRPDYENRVTTILCNTEVISAEKNQYADKAIIEKNALLIATPSKGTRPPEDGYLDQTSICPPDNPFIESKNSYIYDIGQKK